MRRTLYLLPLALLLAASSSRAARPASSAQDLRGSLGGAPYHIRVPERWNGTLLVYAHGYRDAADHPGETEDRSVQAAPGGAPLEDVLLVQGYALAGSAFRENGWAVKEGIQDLAALTRFFHRTVGKPRQVILWGFSLGSVMALESIEKHPRLYDGVIAGCALGAGTPRMMDRALDLMLAYDVAFGMPASWGTPGDIRDDLDFDTEVLPIIFQQFTDPANQGRLEFMRLIAQVTPEAFYPPAEGNVFQELYFATEARAELERRAGGAVSQNRTHSYSLTGGEQAYLASIGVNAELLIQQMNARTTFSADPSARQYVERYADYTGRIRGPVLTLHTVHDALVPPANEARYRETVTAAGRDAGLVQVFTNGVGHCAFTGEQLVTVVAAMQYWLQSGTPPPAGIFPEAFGFVPGYEPPAWPPP